MDSRGGDANKPFRRQNATSNVSTGESGGDNLAAVEHRNALFVVPSKAGPSVTSIASCDSGYEQETGSTRTSTVFEDSVFPQNVDNVSEVHKTDDCIVEKDGQSAGSSPYVTALTSLHISAASSIDGDNHSPKLSLQVSPVVDGLPIPHTPRQSTKKDEESPEEHSEVDGPFPVTKKAPKLIKTGKSQSVECPTTQHKPRLRRASQTVPIFDSSIIQEAVIKVQAYRQELDEGHEQALRQTMKDNAVAFRDSVDFTILLAHLFKHNLVHESECEFLNSKEHSCLDKANRFFFGILNRKGPSAYRSFYYALDQEKQHKGHQYLVELMNSAFHQLAK